MTMEAVKLSVHPNPMSAELARNALIERGLNPLPVRWIHSPSGEYAYAVYVPEDQMVSASRAIRESKYA